VLTNRNGEVRAVAIDKFKWYLEGTSMDTRVQGKFHYREMFSPVFLIFVTEEAKILLNFLILVLNFAVSFRVIGSSEAYSNTKLFVESIHKSGCKLWAAIREDFLWNSMEAEDVLIVKFCERDN
jgi:hypothetical protein